MKERKRERKSHYFMQNLFSTCSQAQLHLDSWRTTSITAAQTLCPWGLHSGWQKQAFKHSKLSFNRVDEKERKQGKSFSNNKKLNKDLNEDKGQLRKKLRVKNSKLGKGPVQGYEVGSQLMCQSKSKADSERAENGQGREQERMRSGWS